VNNNYREGTLKGGASCVKRIRVVKKTKKELTKHHKSNERA
jgi:hypothetical protein